MRKRYSRAALLVLGTSLWAASMVYAQPSISPSQLNFSANVGSQTLSQMARITHPGPRDWDSTISGGSWLSMSPRSGTTDQDVTVTVNTAGLSAGTYNGSITFQVNPPIGFTVGLGVRLVISGPPPGGGVLAVSPARFDLVVAQGGSTDFSFAVSEAASAVNEVVAPLHSSETSSSAAVNWTAALTLLNGSNWLTITPTSGTATPQQSSVVTGRVNAATLPAPGVYQALIVVTETTTRRAITVAVSLVVRGNDPRLALSQPAFVFFAAQGGPAPPPERLRIFNAGGGLANWTISGMPTWLTVSPAAGTATTNPAQISQTSLTANPAGLAPGVYQAVLSVSAPGAGSDALVAVTFQVLAPTQPPRLAANPMGLVFTAVAGGQDPTLQSIVISNSGGGSVSFAVEPSTTSGGQWLSASVRSGSTTAGPVTVQTSVIIGALDAGVYRGKIAVVPTSGATLEVDVTLILASGTVIAASSTGRSQICTASGLEVAATTLGNGLSATVSYPRAVLALAVDTCGTAISNATVLATIGAANIPLQALGAGLYTGTWVPDQTATAIPVTLTARHPSFAAVARRQFTVSAAAAAGADLPVLLPDGVVEGAGFIPRRPLAPGGIVSLFGVRFGGTGEGPTRIPLERELAGISVRIGQYSAPLFFTGAGQINAQVPLELAPGENVSVVVSSRGRLTAPQTYLIAPVQPGIFRDSAGTRPIILDARPVDPQLISPQNPAFIGDTVVIYATGMGQTDPPAMTGSNTGTATRLRMPVTVTIGGQPATVVYQGLAPSFVGLNQINVTVPAVTPGDAVPVVVTQNGITSNPEQTLAIAVRAR